MKAAFAPVPDELNTLSRVILDCAFRVHRALGPGLLESTYRVCLVHELRKTRHSVEQEVALPVVYDGVTLETGYRIDVLVDDRTIVELKAIDEVLSIHRAQLLSYLKHANKRLGPANQFQ